MVLGRIFVIPGILFHFRDCNIDIRRIFDQLAHTLDALELAYIAELSIITIFHNAHMAGVVHIRVVIMRAGIGVAEAKHILPFHLRRVFRVRYIQ